MSLSKFQRKIDQDNLIKINIGYPMIIGSVGLVYWYFGLNMEVIDAAMILGMCWIYWKFETSHPNLWIEFKLRKVFLAFISVCCGLTALFGAKLLISVIFP
jgi:hypothetical protein